MVTHTIEVGGFDYEALANEVLSSAVRILLVSGVSEVEIASAFEQAAIQLRDGSEFGDHNSGLDDREPDDEDQGIWSLSEQFEERSEVKALNRMAKRLDALEDREDALSRAKALALLQDAIGERRSLLGWLRQEAQKLGIQVENCRQRWIEKASDDELDREYDILFLDDHRWASDFNWYIVGDIASNLACDGYRNELAAIGELALDEDTAFSKHVRDDVENALGLAGEHDAFRAYVLEQSGRGEFAQAEFLHQFSARHEFSDEYRLEMWLNGMASQGEIERYKRSNRWRILVP